MKKYIILLIIILCANSLLAGDFSVYEANYPGVKDYNVNIDEATLVVHPQGNFIEMNLYMTVSYDFTSWFFKNYNELEFLWEFSLPEHAIMHEFWVWFGDSIMSAEVLDKWTAELLFSDVSSAVRNPGLLTQSKADRNGQVDYKLRLYPITRNEKKRFKIQYLLPGRPTVESIRAWLPTSQLISTKSPGIDSLRIIYKYDDISTEPEIVGTEIISKEYSPKDTAWIITIPLEFDQFVELVLPSPIKDNYYFSTFKQNEEYFYHLAVYPPEVQRQEGPRNILIVIDFNRFNTNGLDGEFLISHLKETVQQAFTEADSINLIVAYDNILQASEKWVSCSEENIDNLFTLAMKRSFPSYSNFQPLTTKAAAFINNQKDSADVFFFSNTDEIGLNADDIDQLADEVIAMFKPGTKLHFIDLENKSGLRYNYETGTGYYETQLASFYGHITYATMGNLYFLRYHTIKTILGALFYEEISHFESVEVQLDLQEGYAHSKHLLALNEGYYPLHFPIMQVGKFDGRLPLEITLLGKIRMTKVIDQFTITESDVVPGNSQIATSWYGDHIRTLLRYSYSPITVNDIINLSIEQKILTPYSGFLIYYPDEEHGYCQDCIDETILSEINTEKMEIDSSIVINAFPNPFNSDVSITFQIPEAANLSDFDLSIYNTLGQTVFRFDISNQLSKSERIVKWNGQNSSGCNVASGIYLAIIKGPEITKTFKLLLVR